MAYVMAAIDENYTIEITKFAQLLIIIKYQMEMKSMYDFGNKVSRINQLSRRYFSTFRIEYKMKFKQVG